MTIIGHNLAAEVAFKNCAPVIKFIPKTDATTEDDAEHLDLIMPMYNSTENNTNYFDMKDSL